MLTIKDINYKSSCSILRPLNDPVAALSLHFSCCSQELRLMELKILICYLWRKDFKLWVLFLCAKKKKKGAKLWDIVFSSVIIKTTKAKTKSRVYRDQDFEKSRPRPTLEAYM